MAANVKTSWADDVDEFDGHKNVDTTDDNGVRTTIEYTTNEDGKKVKITRRTKRTLQKSVVEHAVAERQKWPKFGADKNSKPGPDRNTTIVGEAMTLKITAGNKTNDADGANENEGVKSALAMSKGGGKVTCRLCKGEHFTAKCPYKESLGAIDAGADTGADDDVKPQGDGGFGAAAATGGSKYLPPSMRPGAKGAGEAMGRPGGTNRDDLPTLRVTNISEDTNEDDLRELFQNFGRVARVYVGRDRETGAGKGFAFVSFEDKSNAEKAMAKIHGKGYDNLILSVQWSQPRPEGK